MLLLLTWRNGSATKPPLSGIRLAKITKPNVDCFCVVSDSESRARTLSVFITTFNQCREQLSFEYGRAAAPKARLAGKQAAKALNIISPGLKEAATAPPLQASSGPGAVCRRNAFIAGKRR